MAAFVNEPTVPTDIAATIRHIDRFSGLPYAIFI